MSFRYLQEEDLRRILEEEEHFISESVFVRDPKDGQIGIAIKLVGNLSDT